MEFPKNAQKEKQRICKDITEKISKEIAEGITEWIPYVNTKVFSMEL